MGIRDGLALGPSVGLSLGLSLGLSEGLLDGELVGHMMSAQHLTACFRDVGEHVVIIGHMIFWRVGKV